MAAGGDCQQAFDPSELSRVLLSDEPELVDELATFLTNQWPKYPYAKRQALLRRNSLPTKLQSLPCNLMLMHEPSGTGPEGSPTSPRRRVVAHARVVEGYVNAPGTAMCAAATSVTVDPSLRRCGVGRLMMQYAEDVAQGHGFDSLHVWTDDMQTFYRSLGYEEVPQFTWVNFQVPAMAGMSRAQLEAYHKNMGDMQRRQRQRAEAAARAAHAGPPPPAPAPAPAPANANASFAGRLTEKLQATWRSWGEAAAPPGSVPGANGACVAPAAGGAGEVPRTYMRKKLA